MTRNRAFVGVDVAKEKIDEAIRLAFQGLQARLAHEPLPDRSWMNRVLKISRSYPTFSGNLYHSITGQPLPSSE